MVADEMELFSSSWDRKMYVLQRRQELLGGSCEGDGEIISNKDTLGGIVSLCSYAYRVTSEIMRLLIVSSGFIGGSSEWVPDDGEGSESLLRVAAWEICISENLQYLVNPRHLK